jgi:hypothetical protein
MMSERIFVRTPEFLAGIAALNQLAEAETEPVKVFISLLQSEAKAEKKNDLMVSTLAAFLDRVAYFPLRPSDMQVNWKVLKCFNKCTVSYIIARYINCIKLVQYCLLVKYRPIFAF